MRFAMLRLPRSLVARALLASVGALLLVMALIFTAFTFVVTWQDAPFRWEGLQDHAELIEEGIRFDANARPISLELTEDIRQTYDGLPKDLSFQVLDSAGAELFVSNAGPALAALRSLPLRESKDMARISAGGIFLRVLTTDFRRDDKTYFIRVARSERLASVVRETGSAIAFGAGLVATVLAVLVFSCIVLWTARRVVRPLRDVSAAAAAIEPGNLTQRLSSQGLPSELTPLIDAFNNALERLAKAYRVQQDFLASAAHELKTPLSLIRAEIEMESAPNREILLKDVDVMARQVHQLLQLAEVSETQNYKFERLDAVAALDEAVAYTTRLADRQGVRVAFGGIGEMLMIDADRGALFILGKNLIENAIHHSPPGGLVTLRLDLHGFSVIDSGAGVAPEDVSKLFTRFWRGAHAGYEGAGLGLSICNEIALAHRWRLSHRHAQSGVGAEFHVAF